MKKFAMAAVAALSLSTVSAESCASSFSGFYAGVQAGMNSTTGTLNIDGYIPTNTDTSKSSYKGTAGKKSFLGGIFAGYGMGVGSCAYVGAELYGNLGNSSNVLFDTTNHADDSKSFKITATKGYTIGGKVRLGYTVSQQAMIFIGLGLEYAKSTLKSENVQSAFAQSAITTTVTKKKGNISFAPSVGMDMFLNKNLFVRGEYTYVVGKKQKLDADQKNTRPTIFTATTKATMTQQRFALGLGYKF
jgi:opacity protein-like surface antigen